MIPSDIFFYLSLPVLALGARPARDAILLSDVKSLTFRGNGAMTSHRRVPAIPQLKCVSGRKLCSLYEIDVMRCTNQGSSYGDEDIQWSCTASLPEELKLGSTDVVCEGYSSPDDPYILKGSCAVEYRLSLTRKGEHRYPNLPSGEGGSDWASWVFIAIFLTVAAWIIWSAFQARQGQNNRPPRNNRRGGGWNPGWGPGGGGGGGGGGWDDPPPPYPGLKPRQQQQGWAPGFWSGLAGGAAAGYVAGNRNRNDNSNRGYGSFRGGQGWGGSSDRSSSAGSSSGNRHESTGFGSTSRR